jgi:L-fuculose-phosphate aldolase
MYSEECGRIGRRLFAEGLVSGNFGNMSICAGNGFFITAGGALLDEPGELVPVTNGASIPPDASSEYLVHQMTYRKTDYKAIVHAHPPFAIAASLALDEISPVDSEEKMLCPLIGVVEGEPGSKELAVNVSGALAGSRIVVARGHGTFAAGTTLTEAYLITSAAEHACRIIYYSGGFGGFRR